jgi:hypothetical protein
MADRPIHRPTRKIKEFAMKQPDIGQKVAELRQQKNMTRNNWQNIVR